ncbi:MAG: CocE/NonD family hydrolase [Melioribacteraceae bacterium]|nr:CocE/NonD family hydrolase [Melioribacteraceae bacterium]
MKKFLLIIILFLVSANYTAAQNKEYLKENYVKKEYQIEMRDGVNLFTSAYIPKNDSVKYPILLQRTPYSVWPYGEDKFPGNLLYAEEGFIYVFQDVRGKFMSEGEYVNMRPYITNKKKNDIDETTDSYDTIEWLINNIPNNNGNVATWGTSYPGFYAAMSCIDAHPALKASSPQAPIADWFIGDDMHHNGALSISLSYTFFSVFGIVRPEPTNSWPKRNRTNLQDAYNYFLEMGPVKNTNQILKGEIPFWNETLKHDKYDDFWQSRNTLPHFNNVDHAVMVVGGWFDNEDLYGEINTYKSIEDKNENNKATLVMGPWDHGGWHRKTGDTFGDMDFGSATSKFYQENIELPYFNFYLKEKGELNLPEVYAFETGNNKWNKFEHWPPLNATPKKLYLNKDENLSFDIPSFSSAYSYDEYISDPKNPVPYSAKFHDARRMYDRTYLVDDQRFASTRPDVLVYETSALTEDITIAGDIIADLYVSTSGTDSDWIVKLIDVYPDDAPDPDPNTNKVQMGGYEMLVRADIMRGKFRESFILPKPFKPREVTQVKFKLNDAHHTFKKGHKMMVQIQSSWFPMFDLNPQKYVDINECSKEDFQKATQRIYRSKDYPSSIEIKILK